MLAFPTVVFSLLHLFIAWKITGREVSIPFFVPECFLLLAAFCAVRVLSLTAKLTG